LEEKIRNTLANEKICFVREEELRRAWPGWQDRYEKVTRFAEEHGWSVFSYVRGYWCAIVEKPSERPVRLRIRKRRRNYSYR
jgi:hypothetical protein